MHFAGSKMALAGTRNHIEKDLIAIDRIERDIIPADSTERDNALNRGAERDSGTSRKGRDSYKPIERDKIITERDLQGRDLRD